MPAHPHLRLCDRNSAFPVEPSQARTTTPANDGMPAGHLLDRMTEAKALLAALTTDLAALLAAMSETTAPRSER